jgi:steroid 5-alpha reductase family enzyme
MNFLSLFLTGGGVIFGLMVLLWLVSLILKNSSIVDIFWGAGFVISAWLYFFISPEGFLLRKLIILALVTIWGMRLTLHILTRNWGKPEDFRYQKWREQSGKIWWIKSLFQVFLLQGLLMWVISTPLLAAQYYRVSAPFTWVDGLAIILWAIGFLFEALGDTQLAKFRANPGNHGKLLNTGVWHYTRHPNYFGDSAQWWAFYLLALAAGGWWTIFSPIIMTLFLIKVSGVALLEKSLANSKPGYKEYMESTSPFIPWFPKKDQSKEHSKPNN